MKITSNKTENENEKQNELKQNNNGYKNKIKWE